MSDKQPVPRALRQRDSAQTGPLAALPLFWQLQGRRTVVIGGTRAAAWKAELLVAAGAAVEIYAIDFDQHILELSQTNQNIQLFSRNWQKTDFAGAAMAVVDAADENEAQKLKQAAVRSGVPINVIDKPDWSDFTFGSIVDRSPLLIAISTGGGAPVLGQKIRSRIETLFPDGLRYWAAAALAWRPSITEMKLPAQTRRFVWGKFAERALARPQDRPEALFKAELLAAARQAGADEPKGSVVLAGAGPGDEELLTLKAVRALQSADSVLYDDLVAPAVLQLARREADKISVGKRGYKPSCSQEDICALMIELARSGKRVVRLKGGDPMVFGRAGEELTALAAAGIPVEVIPGVTAASAAAATIGLSLTERDISRRLQFVTAHARGGQLPDDLNWSALADPLATTIVYMGVRTLPLLCARLIEEGLPPDTPAVITAHVTWDSEKFVHGTIATLPNLAADADIASPALAIIGQIAAAREGSRLAVALGKFALPN